MAVPTVYASLRSKANILRAVFELTVRGGDESVPLAARAAWRELEARGPARTAGAVRTVHTPVCEREAPVFAQIEAAAGADAEATELLAEHDALRYETQSRLARGLHRRRSSSAASARAGPPTSSGRSRASAPTRARARPRLVPPLRTLAGRAAHRRPSAAPIEDSGPCIRLSGGSGGALRPPEDLKLRGP